MAPPGAGGHLHSPVKGVDHTHVQPGDPAGGLLLLCGRAGDLFGRRWVFVGGAMVFTAASLLGRLAPSAGALIAARALQGVGAAFAGPSTLALIATNFADGPPRTRALALFS